MLTDTLPSNEALRAQFTKSDRLRTLKLPDDDRLRHPTMAIKEALASGNTEAVKSTCIRFVTAAAEVYKVSPPKIRILGSRPRYVWERGVADGIGLVGVAELHGDYQPATRVIRTWMRTAVRKEIIAFGSFFFTLCHEFCHHLNLELFKFHDSPHTRGFCARTDALYHHGRGTKHKRLFWISLPNGRYQLDWLRTKRGS